MCLKVEGKTLDGSDDQQKRAGMGKGGEKDQ